MSKDAVEGNLVQVIRNLQRRISALERQQQDVGQLSELSGDLGLVTAGEFRAGNGVEPGEGFSGVRMTEAGVNGYDNDVLQSGMSATDGKITAGAGAVTLDVDGIVIDHNELSDINDPNSIRWLDGSTLKVGLIEYTPPGGTVRFKITVDSENFVFTSDGELSCTTGTFSDSNITTANIITANIETASFGDTGAITGGSETINDDSAFSFTPATARGILIFRSGGANTTIYGMFTYAAVSGTAYCYAWTGAGSAMAATTGALAGTTGTDGKVTVAAHTDGKIYIENRSGGKLNCAWQIVAGT